MIRSSFGHSSHRAARSPLPVTNRGVSGSTEGEFVHLHTFFWLIHRDSTVLVLLAYSGSSLRSVLSVGM